jgi:hypothetical protein
MTVTIQITLNVEIQTSWKINTEFMMNLTKHISKILLLPGAYRGVGVGCVQNPPPRKSEVLTNKQKLSRKYRKLRKFYSMK